MTKTNRSRSTAQDWLDHGLEILRAQGDRGLTVEALCSVMAKTKGSFYHHFTDREDFVMKLLAHWERAFTGRVIEELKPLESPRRRLRALGERIVREIDLRLERAIRVWGDREPLARVVLERVDRARERYVHEQFEAANDNPRTALAAARAHLALLVGIQMLYQDLSRTELRELNAFAGRLGFVARPAETPPAETKHPTTEESS